jgi:hypothetical protein
VGATPKRQQIAIFVGVVTSAIFVGPVLAAVNRGATATVPESHPGVQVTHPSAERIHQREFSFAPGAGALAGAGLGGEELFRQLWGRGVEVRLDGTGNPVALRTFRGDLAPSELAQEEVRGTRTVRLAELATLGSPVERTLQAGFVRNDAPVPTGKYLSSPEGTIGSVGDPGIGGRVEEVHGLKLTRYEAPQGPAVRADHRRHPHPQAAWDLVLLGVALALMLELSGVSALPFAVGVYLPMSTTAPLFVGGAVRWLVDRRRGASESDTSPGTLLSSGYIAGGSLAGVAINLLHIPEGGWMNALDLPARLAGRSGWLAGLVEALGQASVPIRWPRCCSGRSSSSVSRATCGGWQSGPPSRSGPARGRLRGTVGSFPRRHTPGRSPR